MTSEQTPDARIEAAAQALQYNDNSHLPGDELSIGFYRLLAKYALAAADRAAPSAPPDAWRWRVTHGVWHYDETEPDRAALLRHAHGVDVEISALYAAAAPPAIPPRPLTEKDHAFYEEAMRADTRVLNRVAAERDRLAEALRALVSETHMTRESFDNAREVLGDYDARTEAKG